MLLFNGFEYKNLCICLICSSSPTPTIDLAKLYLGTKNMVCIKMYTPYYTISEFAPQADLRPARALAA